MTHKRIATTLSLMDIMERFGTEERAVQWFEQVLWNNIPTCAHCGNTEGNVASPKQNQPFAYRCASCGQRFTVRMGTVMELSRLPLRKWAVVCMPSSRHGRASAAINSPKNSASSKSPHGSCCTASGKPANRARSS